MSLNAKTTPYLLTRAGVYVDPSQNIFHIESDDKNNRYEHRCRNNSWSHWTARGTQIESAVQSRGGWSDYINASGIALFDRNDPAYRQALKEFEAGRDKTRIAMRQVGKDTWRSKNGWIITKDAATKVYSLFHKDTPHAVVTERWLNEFLHIDFFHSNRFDLLGDCGIVFSPAHFNKGDVITTVKKYKSYSPRNSPEQYTVKDVRANGLNSFIIITEETVTDERSPFYGEEYSFNISFVASIVKKSHDKTKFSLYSPKPRTPSCRYGDGSAEVVEKLATARFGANFLKTWRLYDDQDHSFPWFAENAYDGNKGGLTVNRAKLLKRLRAMGLVRTIAGPGWSDDGWVRMWHFIKVKDVTKFLKKNPHWVFNNVQFVSKMNWLAEQQSWIDE